MDWRNQKRSLQVIESDLNRNFDEDTKILKQLAEEYYQFVELPSLNEQNDSNSTSCYTEEEEAEEDSNDQDRLILKTKMEAYLSIKLPIENYETGAIEQLPENKRQTLLQHNSEIFADGITYHQQMLCKQNTCSTWCQIYKWR